MMIGFRSFLSLLALPLLVGLCVDHLIAQVAPSPIIWYRADSGVVREGEFVTEWRDVSGNGNHTLLQTGTVRPTYLATSDAGGKPSLKFSGAEFLRTPDIFPILSDYTKIAVVRINNYAAINNILSGTTTHAFWMGASRYPKMFHQGNFADSYQELAGTFSILRGEFDDSERRGAIYQDGKFGGAGFTGIRNDDNTLYIGAFAGGSFIQGEICEVLIYDRLLSNKERAETENYLANKYKIALQSQPDV